MCKLLVLILTAIACGHCPNVRDYRRKYFVILNVLHYHQIFSVHSKNAAEFELEFAVDPTHFQSANLEYREIPLVAKRLDQVIPVILCNSIVTSVKSQYKKKKFRF